MTFETNIEIDAVEIYQFTYEKDLPDRYASNFEDVTVTLDAAFALRVGEVAGSDTLFLAETIKRSEVSMSGEMNKSVIQLQTTKNNKIAGYFISGTPLYPINVKIWRMSEPNKGSDKLLIFQGRVTGCTLSGLEATLNCEPMYTQLQKAGLRRMYEPRCSHVLYDPATCKRMPDVVLEVEEELTPGTPEIPEQEEVSSPDADGYTITTIIPAVPAVPPTYKTTSVDALSLRIENTIENTYFSFNNEGAVTVSSPAFLTKQSADATYFTGGILEVCRKGSQKGSQHMIATHATNTITLIRPIPPSERLDVTSIVLKPGCDHIATTCCKKFNNSVNFGGFPYMSAANPFAGTHVPSGA